MMLGGTTGEVNPNSGWLNSRGMWLSYLIGVLIIHIALLSIPFLTTAWAWTLTSVIHNLVSFSCVDPDLHANAVIHSVTLRCFSFNNVHVSFRLCSSCFIHWKVLHGSQVIKEKFEHLHIGNRSTMVLSLRPHGNFWQSLLSYCK